MTAFIVQTMGMDAVRWCGQMALSLSQYGTIPKLLDPAKWRAWASAVVAIPSIAAVGPPRPEGFETWEAWARQFNLVLRLLE